MNEKELINLVEKIETKLLSKEDCEDLIEMFQSNVTYPNVRELFEGDNSTEYIAKRALSYKQVMIGELSREELIELVEKIMNCECKEYEIDGMIDVLVQAVVDPNIINYIYWSDEELTPEEIVDKALSYKPITL